MNPILNNLDFSLALLKTFKWFLVIGAGFYVVFAFVVIRQISVMKKTLITVLSPNITMLGYLHMVFAVGVFATFLLWL